MASKFNIVAELQLRGPKNLNQITKQIQGKLGNLNANVNIRLNKQTEAQLKSIVKSLRAIATSSKSASSSANNATKSISNTGKAAKNAATNLQSAATGAAAFGKQSALAVKRFAAFSVGAGIMMGITNAIREGTKAAIDFERQMVRVSQVTGKAMSNLKGLSGEISNLSTSLGVSSAELIDVARIMSQTGLAANDVTKAMKTLALSSLAPTFKDMANTAEGAIAIMRQFGVTADQLAGKLGSINALAGQFAVESQDLIFAIRRAGGAFQAAGGSLEELLALFTSVRATTRESAETIATGFRTIFTRIQRPKTIEFLRSTGVELQNLQGNFVGPFEAVKRLNQALSSLETTDPRFAKIVEELGGFRQVSKVIPLIQQFATAQQALRVAQEGQGSLAKDAATAQQSLAIQIAKVREEFLALFRDLTGSSTFKSITSVILGMASSFIKVADAIKPVLPLLGALAAFQGAKMAFQFGAGFVGGVRGGGGAGAVGQNLGGAASGQRQQAANQQVTQAMTKLTAALASNTSSIQANSSAIQKLSSAMIALPKQIRLSMPMGGGRRPFATGGIVPGTGNRDTVPAMLTPGEFVIRKSSVKKYGAENLQKMNLGGRVPASSTVTPGGTLLFNSPIRLLQRGTLRGERASQLAAAQAQGRSKDMEILKTDKKTKIASGGNQLKAAFGAAETRALGMADTDSYGGAFMVTPGTSESFLGTNRAFGPLIKKTKGYQTYLQRKKLLSPELKALAETREKDIFEKYRTKNKYALHAGALLPGVSEKVEDTLLNGVNRTVNRAARNINAEAGAATDAAAIVAAMKSANIDQTMGNLFENVLMAAGTPFSPKDGDAANAAFDFPKGLGARKKSFAMPGAKGNIPVDAKTRFTRPNMRSLISKVENFNTKEAERELDLVFQGMASQIPVGKASGGGISGSDTVPALLTPGEFVVNKKSAQRIGVNNLNAINKGRIQGFASGGPVGVQKFQGGGQVGMGLMMAPMAIQMIVDAFGGVNEGAQEVITTFSSMAMLFGTVSMFLPSMTTLKAAAFAASKALMTISPGLGKGLLSSFGAITAGVLAVSAIFAGLGIAAKMLGDSMQKSAIKAAENSKNAAEESKARKDFVAGQRTSRAGTGAAIGAVAGIALAPILGPFGPAVGAAAGAVIGAALKPDFKAINQAIERGRQTRFMSQMASALEEIKRGGLNIGSLGELTSGFESLGRNVINATGEENQKQFREDFSKQLPKVRGVIDEIAKTSDSFADFETKMGGLGGRLLDTIRQVDPSLWRSLKEDLEKQITIGAKLRAAKRAEVEAAKNARSLSGELNSFNDGLKRVNASLKSVKIGFDQIGKSFSGTGDALFGGKGVQTDVFKRVSAGENVDAKVFADAVKQVAPNEAVAREGIAAGKLMTSLPQILQDTMKQARIEGTGGDKIGAQFIEAARINKISGAAVEQIAANLQTMAGQRNKSEGSIIGDIDDDVKGFAQKLQTESMKAMMSGFEETAKQMQETFSTLHSIQQSMLKTEMEIANHRIATMKLVTKLDRQRESQGRSTPRAGGTGTELFLQEQRALLGEGGPNDISGLAGDIPGLGEALLKFQKGVKETQEKIKAFSAAGDADQVAKLTNQLNKMNSGVQKTTKALEHASKSSVDLADAQDRLKQAQFKTDTMTRIAFAGQDEQAQFAQDVMAATDIVRNPDVVNQNINQEGDAAAAAYRGGVEFLKQLQQSGINEFAGQNIQDSIDNVTVSRMVDMSRGMIGSQDANTLAAFNAAGDTLTEDDIRKFFEKQIQNRRDAENDANKIIERQIQAMDALKEALIERKKQEQLAKENAELEAKKATELKKKEDEKAKKEKEKAEAEKTVSKEAERQKSIEKLAGAGIISPEQAKQIPALAPEFAKIKREEEALDADDRLHNLMGMDNLASFTRGKFATGERLPRGEHFGDHEGAAEEARKGEKIFENINKVYRDSGGDLGKTMDALAGFFAEVPGASPQELQEMQEGAKNLLLERHGFDKTSGERDLAAGKRINFREIANEGLKVSGARQRIANEAKGSGVAATAARAKIEDRLGISGDSIDTIAGDVGAFTNAATSLHSCRRNRRS